MFNFILDFMSRTGCQGVFVLMFVENLFPPNPSGLIMPLAGFAAARGDSNVVLVVLTGSDRSMVGSLPWFTQASGSGTSG